MTALVILPLSCVYPLEQRSSSGMDRFFTVCNQACHAWGLGSRSSPVSISTQASAASASRAWEQRNGPVAAQPASPLGAALKPASEALADGPGRPHDPAASPVTVYSLGCRSRRVPTEEPARPEGPGKPTPIWVMTPRLSLARVAVGAPPTRVRRPSPAAGTKCPPRRGHTISCPAQLWFCVPFSRLWTTGG